MGQIAEAMEQWQGKPYLWRCGWWELPLGDSGVEHSPFVLVARDILFLGVGTAQVLVNIW